MKIYSFKNDYSEGTHPIILEKLIITNLQQQNGYEEDEFCDEAKVLIKKKLNNDRPAIHFVSGGTQANLIVISSILKSHESVIAAECGHIAVHETGAIEATGHKVNVVTSRDGKLVPENIKNILDLHTDAHMVKPKLVYISNSTEIGSIYTKEELIAISTFCKKNNLYLFVDGARLGSALCSYKNDLTLEDLSNLTDIFYIGGTKNGALIGEAIVINNLKLDEDFRYNIKQRGGMLAKGRLLGIQFSELFRDNLFFELGKHANEMASKLAIGLSKKGFKFLSEPLTNQIFPILPLKTIEELQENFDFYIWEKYDKQHSIIRLVTSWATKEEMVEEFLINIK